LNRLTIRIVPEVNFNKKNLEFITQIIRKRSTKWQVEFEFVDEIEKTDAGKYRFVINRLKE
jgi:phenylacetate-CoA ligase